MSEMLEKQAEAIWLADGPWRCGVAVPWSQADDTNKERFRELAKAALEAMREPTDEMINMGEDLADVGASAETIFSGMMDGALKDS